MRKIFLPLVALVAISAAARAQQEAANSPQADTLFTQLLTAQSQKNYEAFVANGTLELKAALTKTQFDASCDLLNARCKGGYDVVPLGELHQRGFDVHLYRLRFKDGGDDMLATLSLKNGQIAGIYFK